MDDFLEGIFSEDSDELDYGEAEAALYSAVHHREDNFSTTMLDFGGSYIQQRNSVDRWEVLKQIGDSVKPDNYIFHSQEINQGLDHIPFVDNNISSISKTMFGHEFNKRGHNANYRRNEKPRNIHDRVRNIYQRKSNLVPIFVRRNEFSQRFTADPQAILKVNNYSSFENPRKNIQNVNYRSETIRENVGMFEYHGRTSGEGIVNNSVCGMEERSNVFRKKSCHGMKVAGDHDAWSSTEQSSSSMLEISSNDCPPKMSNSLLNHNSNLSAIEKNNTEIVDVSCAITEEIITVSDTDGNEHSDQSVVEVCVPPKPSPPLVALDSSDESETVGVSSKSLILNVSESSNKSATDTSHFNKSTPLSSKNMKNPLFTVSSTSKEIKKKKKKGKKHKLVNSFECKSWTTGMIQFYNTSWGGETYDHQKLQREMTPNPSKWQILDIDKYGPVRDSGPRIRCANCHQFGHMARHCPDPKKIRCCTMCGVRGHVENQCPNKLCLKCGRPAPIFNEGCPSCWNNPPNCASCGGVDHFNWMCPDVWRKLHSVTTTEDFEAGVLNETMYKSSMEQNCCFCAGKGHLATACPSKLSLHESSKQTFSSPKPPSLDIFTTFNILSKKRKKNRSSFREEKYNQQDYRKRRKTN